MKSRIHEIYGGFLASAASTALEKHLREVSVDTPEKASVIVIVIKYSDRRAARSYASRKFASGSGDLQE